jgi:hypothetical protein
VSLHFKLYPAHSTLLAIIYSLSLCVYLSIPSKTTSSSHLALIPFLHSYIRMLVQFCFCHCLTCSYWVHCPPFQKVCQVSVQILIECSLLTHSTPQKVSSAIFMITHHVSLTTPIFPLPLDHQIVCVCYSNALLTYSHSSLTPRLYVFLVLIVHHWCLHNYWWYLPFFSTSRQYVFISHCLLTDNIIVLNRLSASPLLFFCCADPSFCCF